MRQIGLFGFPVIENEICEAIPYMGNKRKLATKILNHIYQTVGDFENFYDLFGGGASVSVAGLKAGHKVYYNELNTGVVNLLKHIVSGGEIPYNWVTREEFHAQKEKDDWYAGLIKTCWCFGNNYQKGYLYGEDIEDLKKEATEYLFKNGYDKTPETRIKLIDEFKKQKKITDRLELERLEQLQQLERLEQLQQLEITNLSYEDVEIKDNSVVYCDIPYKDTESYQEGKNFDYEMFYEWCFKQKCPVFVSEYNMPEQFKIVAEFEHISTLSSTNKSKRTIERVYWNGKN